MRTLAVTQRVIRRCLHTHSSVSSWQSGSSCRAASRRTPESHSSFRLRSSTLRCEGFERRAEAKEAQPSPVTPHFTSLQRGRSENSSLFKPCSLSCSLHVLMVEECWQQQQTGGMPVGCLSYDAPWLASHPGQGSRLASPVPPVEKVNPEPSNGKF